MIQKDGLILEGNNAVELDLRSIAKGVYMMNLVSSESKSVTRLVIE